MITIRQFSHLCGCSTQTLRYYDRIGLLKPLKVDPDSGYRYYSQEHAVEFVKIKNFQAADFSIREIQIMLKQSDQEILDAFREQIARQEEKLEKIKQISQTYLQEKNSMETLIHSISNFLLRCLNDFEGLREFGMEPSDKETVLQHLRTYLNRWMVDPELSQQEIRMLHNEELICGSEAIARRVDSFAETNLGDTILLGGESVSQEDTFDPEQFETLWQCHRWVHVRDFLPQIPPLEPDREYCLRFFMPQEQTLSFPLFMLAAMILKKDAAGISMGCMLDNSEDGENHFLLMVKK